MPSIIPGYEYDIFISYRRKDNKGDCWVTRFVSDLRNELETTFKEDISIYFDENPHDGLLETHHVGESLERKVRSLILIPILSQTYCDPKSFAWQHEFCAFNTLAKKDDLGRDVKLRNGNVADRILPVQIHDLDADDLNLLSDQLGGPLRSISFIYKEPGVNRPLVSDDDIKTNVNKTKYKNQINKVANAIKEIMLGVKNFDRPRLHSAFDDSFLKETELWHQPSIVVLPFEDMSPEKDQEYFCDGLAEELISVLTKIRDIKVVARTSAFSFKGKEEDARKIGKKLKAESLLEGSVRKAGNKLRITVQLINVADGFPIWSDRYDRELADVFSIQEEIAMNIVDKLRINLLGEERNRILKRQTNNLEAHALYLRGRHFYRQATMDGMEKALKSFQQAIECDPGYAPAFAELAYIYVWVTTAWQALPPRETMPKARAAALQALALDPTLPEAHVSLGLIACFYEWDLPGADRAFKKALQLNSNYAEAHGWYALPLIWLDTRFSEAIQHARRAVDLNPVDPMAWFQIFLAHYFSRDFDGAIQHARHVINLEPLWGLGHYALATALAVAGRANEAMECIDRAIELDGRSVQNIAWLGLVHAISGRGKEALSCLSELEKHEKEGKSVSAWKLVVYAGLGNLDAVMQCLNEGFDERSASLVFHLTHPLTDGLRGDPRFIALLRKMGVEHLATYQPTNSWKPVSDLNHPVGSANNHQLTLRGQKKKIEHYPQEATGIDRKRSIAVLPFVNMSNDQEQEYFCDGLAEELINALTRINNFRVVARTSAFSFKGKEVDIRDIGETLGVDAILEGSVRKAGNRLRITAQLINVEDGCHLWSERYDRDLTDIFAIQDEIALNIVDKLRIDLISQEKMLVFKRHTENVEAHALYLKGRHFSLLFTEESFKKSEQYFYQAAEKDPGYALAYAGLADLYCIMSVFGTDHPREAQRKAAQFAEKALVLDETLAEAHLALAFVKMFADWNWNEAGKEFNRALELGPGSSAVYLNYSLYPMATGSPEEAIMAARGAVDLDPLSATANQNLGFIFWSARKFDESLAQLRKALELNPAHAWAQLEVGWNYAFMGMYEEAIVACKEAINLHHEFDPWFRTSIACIYAMAGKKAYALNALDKLNELSKTKYIDPWNFAVLYSWLGDRERAIQWLEKARNEHSGLCYFVKPCSALWFKPISTDSRFSEILHKMGLMTEHAVNKE